MNASTPDDDDADDGATFTNTPAPQAGSNTNTPPAPVVDHELDRFRQRSAIEAETLTSELRRAAEVFEPSLREADVKRAVEAARQSQWECLCGARKVEEAAAAASLSLDPEQAAAGRARLSAARALVADLSAAIRSAERAAKAPGVRAARGDVSRMTGLELTQAAIDGGEFGDHLIPRTPAPKPAPSRSDLLKMSGLDQMRHALGDL